LFFFFSRSMPRLRSIGKAAIVFLVAAAIYAPTLSHDATMDDVAAVLRNADASGSAPLSRLVTRDFWGARLAGPRSHKSYRPLAVLSLRTVRLACVLTHGVVPAPAAAEGEEGEPEDGGNGTAPEEQPQQPQQGQGSPADGNDKGTTDGTSRYAAPEPILTEADLIMCQHAANVVLHGWVSVLVAATAAALVAWVRVGGNNGGDTAVFERTGARTSSSLSSSSSLTRLVSPGFAAGILFAVHPVASEVVSGLVGRADMLGAAFALLAVSRAATGSPVRAAIYAALAAFSKETAAPVFLVVAVLGLAAGGARRRGPGASQWLAAGSALLLLAAYAALRVWLHGDYPLPTFSASEAPFHPRVAGHLGIVGRALSHAHLHARYVFLLLWPASLCADRSFDCIPPVEGLADPRNVLTLAAYAVVVGGAISSVGALVAHIGGSCGNGGGCIERARAAMAACFLAGLAMFAPASGLLVTVGATVAERLLYLPLACAAILVAVIAEMGTLPSAASEAAPASASASASASTRKASRPSTSLSSSSSSPRHRRMLQVLAVAVTPVTMLLVSAVFASRTAMRVPEWRSDLAVSAAAVGVCPRSSRAQAHLGHLVLAGKISRTDPRDALAIDAAIEATVAAFAAESLPRPRTRTHASAVTSRGATVYEAERAVLALRAAVAVDAGSSVAHALLGGALLAQETALHGPLLGVSAIDVGPGYNTSVRVAPTVAAGSRRGRALLTAAAHLDRAVSIALDAGGSNAYMPGALADRAVIAAALGEYDLAVARAQEALNAAEALEGLDNDGEDRSSDGPVSGGGDNSGAGGGGVDAGGASAAAAATALIGTGADRLRIRRQVEFLAERDLLGSTRGFHADARTGTTKQAAAQAAALVQFHIAVQQQQQQKQQQQQQQRKEAEATAMVATAASAIDSMWVLLRLKGPPRGNGNTMQLMGLTHAAGEEPAKAIAAFRDAVGEEGCHRPLSDSMLCSFYATFGSHEYAIKHCDDAVSAGVGGEAYKGEQVDIWSPFGRALLGGARPVEAAEAFRRAGHSGSAHFATGRALVETHRAKAKVTAKAKADIDAKIRAEFEACVTSEPRSEYAAIAHHELAALDSAAGQIDNATRHYTAAVAGGVRTAELYRNWGAALARAGRKEEARAKFKVALTLGPSQALRVEIERMLLKVRGRAKKA
jgi:tetratricopeptide (TPR) repeat protein